ncbi:hypothetical protein NLG97_g8297 [Lecanicillium saksenae]|uniref:Uncharacterized protein n=1 Tax=Lecanicillium saksenae TaxID=468837 RepID=A0ACC1QJE5_9HYPO|nr:hypothetical protein NLG97_g8297 [Lecanicillium saksenae]
MYLSRSPSSAVQWHFEAAERQAGGIETVQRLKDYVETDRSLHLIAPFISRIRFESDNIRQVQLSHQFLKDWVLQSPPHLWAVEGFETYTSNTSKLQRLSSLHGKMAQDCVRYLLFAEIGAKKSPALDAKESSSDPAEHGFGDFFTYAACNLLNHLYKTEAGSGLSISDAITLTTPGSTRSENWWQQFCRPDCTGQSGQSQARPKSVDPLTIVSLYGSTYLFEELLQNSLPPRKKFDASRRPSETTLSRRFLSTATRLDCRS